MARRTAIFKEPMVQIRIEDAKVLCDVLRIAQTSSWRTKCVPEIDRAELHLKREITRAEMKRERILAEAEEMGEAGWWTEVER